MSRRLSQLEYSLVRGTDRFTIGNIAYTSIRDLKLWSWHYQTGHSRQEVKSHSGLTGLNAEELAVLFAQDFSAEHDASFSYFFPSGLSFSVSVRAAGKSVT